jgi:hypothetical protein
MWLNSDNGFSEGVGEINKAASSGDVIGTYLGTKARAPRLSVNRLPAP